jgi:hypothetical protein
MGPDRKDDLKRARGIFFLLGCAIVAAGNWPVLSLFNRAEPLVLGVPLLFVYVAAFIPLVMGFLYIGYRKGL